MEAGVQSALFGGLSAADGAGSAPARPGADGRDAATRSRPATDCKSRQQGLRPADAAHATRLRIPGLVQNPCLLFFPPTRRGLRLRGTVAPVETASGFGGKAGISENRQARFLATA